MNGFRGGKAFKCNGSFVFEVEGKVPGELADRPRNHDLAGLGVGADKVHGRVIAVFGCERLAVLVFLAAAEKQLDDFGLNLDDLVGGFGAGGVDEAANGAGRVVVPIL